jgi:chromosome partitioning protein
MRKIAMLNQKGGVGKTTSVVNIAAALAQSGKKVVVADFDPQAHLTIHLGVEPDSVESGVYEVLTTSADFDQSLIEVRPNLFLLGANINLVGAESELVSVVGREIIFREAVSKSQYDFDFLIIDCPPSLGLLTLNALACAEEVIIPLQPHFLALQGLGKLLQTVTLVSKRINPNLKVTGALLCMFDQRVSLSEEVKNDIDKFFANAKGTDCPWNSAQVIPTVVRRNIKLAEAPSYGKTVFEYEAECNGSKDYLQIAEFLIHGSSPEQISVEPQAEIQQPPQPKPYQPAPLQPFQPPIQIQPIPPAQVSQPQQQFQPDRTIGQ